MGYPQQHAALQAMETESQQSIDRLIDSGASDVAKLWDQAKAFIRLAISREYSRNKTPLNFAAATVGGALIRIDRTVADSLDWFRRESATKAKSSIRDVYLLSVLRQCWMLDSLTPSGVKVTIPINRRMTEAVRYAGNLGDWTVRWDAWTDAYRTALASNLKMAAINEAEVSDAVELVDKTKPGSPAQDVGNALDRLFRTVAIYSSTEGVRDVAAANRGSVAEEVWQTRYDLSICEDCETQVGLTPEEADFDIPAHPNCRCYWRVVPKDWVDLLKSGKADERELARHIDASGILPSSMLIRDESGNVMSAVTIPFKEWAEENAMILGSGQ